MASHVPFLAISPDNQFSSEVARTRSVSTADKVAVAMDDPSRFPYQVSRVPSVIRFPLVVLVSLSLSTLLHTFTAEFAGFQLATASKDATENWQVGALMGWKLLELFTAWNAGYDYEDLAALTLLTNQPYYFLLYSFWSIELIPVLISLSVDVLSIAVPFALLRPARRAHSPYTAKSKKEALVTDWQIITVTSVLAAAVYASTFYVSYQFNLGVFLITHFESIPSLEMAHNSTVPRLLVVFGAAGLGAMAFLFRPTVAASGKPALTRPKTSVRRFNAETATLGETFAYNLGLGETGWTHRAEVLAKRTSVLAACTIVNTFVRVYGTVEGSDVWGSLGYGALWAAAHMGVGLAYAHLDSQP